MITILGWSLVGRKLFHAFDDPDSGLDITAIDTTDGSIELKPLQ